MTQVIKTWICKLFVQDCWQELQDIQPWAERSPCLQISLHIRLHMARQGASESCTGNTLASRVWSWGFSAIRAISIWSSCCKALQGSVLSLLCKKQPGYDGMRLIQLFKLTSFLLCFKRHGQHALTVWTKSLSRAHVKRYTHISTWLRSTCKNCVPWP